MTNLPDRILEILNQKAKLEWDGKNNFILGSKDKKYIEGTLNLQYDDLFSLEISETNYSRSYLNKKIRNAAAGLNMNSFRFSASGTSFSKLLGPTDIIWMPSDGFGGLAHGKNLTLPKGAPYYKINAYPLICNPVGRLKQNINAAFDSYQDARCSAEGSTMSYAVFQL